MQEPLPLKQLDGLLLLSHIETVPGRRRAHGLEGRVRVSQRECVEHNPELLQAARHLPCGQLRGVVLPVRQCKDPEGTVRDQAVLVVLCKPDELLGSGFMASYSFVDPCPASSRPISSWKSSYALVTSFTTSMRCPKEMRHSAWCISKHRILSTMVWNTIFDMSSRVFSRSIADRLFIDPDTSSTMQSSC
eukprot:Sspe_Gene.65097::Locus_38549_Transcript_1_1_Confidence_1.000_Length_1728::g.65097::m.65097